MLTIVAGAYDGTLHGWQGEVDDMKLAFAFRAHESCIRTVDALGKLACSAATDESIQVYDLARKRVLDRMSGVHEAEVTALAFARDKMGDVFLLSGDASGRIYVWTMRDRKVIHELKGHKQSSAVTSIAIHPSGRVALSTAKDNSLRLWDLVNAKAAPRTKLGDFEVLSCVCWSPPDGARYALVGNETTVLIFDAVSGAEKPIGTFAHPKRVNALKFVQDVVVASACDDGVLRIIGADGSVIREFKAPTPCRLRDIAFVSRAIVAAREDGEDNDSEIPMEQTIVSGVFSDGSIRLWDIEKDEEEPLATLNIGTAAHVTCMSMAWLHRKNTPSRLLASNSVSEGEADALIDNEDESIVQASKADKAAPRESQSKATVHNVVNDERSKVKKTKFALDVKASATEKTVQGKAKASGKKTKGK